MLPVLVPLLRRDKELVISFTLTVTDVSTGWAVNRSVRNKAAERVFEALEHVTAVFAFANIGIDSDNCSESVNGQEPGNWWLPPLRHRRGARNLGTGPGHAAPCHPISALSATRRCVNP